MIQKSPWRIFIPIIGLMMIVTAIVVSGFNPPVKAETPLDTIFVTVEDFTFTPDDITIVVGDTVQWDNILGFHNVVADDNSFTSGPPASAPWSFSHTFNSTGTFAYYCAVHGGPGGAGMSGIITVSSDTPTPTNTSTATNTPTGTPTATVTGTPPTPTTTPTAVPPDELFNYLPIVVR
jgi:plastocyanin